MAPHCEAIGSFASVKERASLGGGEPESIAFRVMAGLGSELGAAEEDGGGDAEVCNRTTGSGGAGFSIVGQAVSPRETIGSDRLASDEL